MKPRSLRSAVSLTMAVVMALTSSSLPLYGQSAEVRSVPSREYYMGEENKLEITVNVWGEVTKPGSYRVPDDTDLVELISLAGGPTDYANRKGIKITRSDGDGQALIEVNLLEYLDGESRASPPVLMPGDTVRVPRNAKHTWRSAIQVLSDLAVIATLYVLIVDRNRHW